MGKKNTAYINKDMLTWARNETPFKSPEMVEISFPDIKAERLIAWENGTDLPSVSDAKRLASIYKVPFASFYLSSAPEKKPRRYADRRTSKNTTYSEISYKLWSEIQRIISNREILLEYNLENDLLSEIPKISSENEDDIAVAIRHFFELKTPLKSKSAFGNNPFSYYRDIIERKGIMVSQINGVSLEEMKGLSIYYDDCPIIAINSKDYNNSKSFSLFHEIAHIFRRSSSLCMIDFEERDDAEESICDRIAAKVLMPKDSFIEIAKKNISKSSTIDSECLTKISGRFGVSTFSVLIRLLELSLISFNDYIELLSVIKEEYENKREIIENERKGKELRIKYHIRYLNQNGYLLSRVLLRSYSSGAISIGEVCKALNVSSKYIPNIEQAVMLK